MSEAPLLVERFGAVAILTLNRPERLNALNGALRAALVEALAACDADEALRAVILTGRGRAFSAGLDVKELTESGRDVSSNIENGDLGGAIAAMRIPVIAAVNGLAVTGGFEITLACDMALASEEAWFQDTHVRIGLLPGWGLSQRLPRLIGLNRAKEISLSGRRVGAAEAAALGFVNRVVPADRLLAEARALAEAVAEGERGHLLRIKRLMDEGFALPFGEALRHEADTALRLNAETILKPRP